MNIKCIKIMYELSEEMNALTKEAKVLRDHGEIDKAVEKMNKYDELSAAYEIEKRVFEAENRFEKPDDTKSIPAGS